MARNFDITWTNYGAKVHVQEFVMGVTGVKEKEEADCPKCGDIV